MEIYSALEALCAAFGAPGGEIAAASVGAQLFSPYGETKTDALGNVTISMGPENAGRHVLLDAHLDQISLIVTHISAKGFLRVAGCGTVDARVVPGLCVKILGKEPITGVVCTTPPHLMVSKDAPFDSMDKLYIDTGLPANKVLELVSPGDYVAFCAPLQQLLKGQVTAAGLDNRASVVALLACAEILSKHTLPCKVTFLLSSREEVGGQGAQVAAFSLAPTEAIVLDVTFAEQPGVSSEKGGKLGGGPMVGFSPVLSRTISKTLLALAKQENIPHQREIMASRTGTNADMVLTSRSGVRTGLLSIPLRYMHTPVEVVELIDIENTAKLLATYVLKGAKI